MGYLFGIYFEPNLGKCALGGYSRIKTILEDCTPPLMTLFCDPIYRCTAPYPLLSGKFCRKVNLDYIHFLDGVRHALRNTASAEDVTIHELVLTVPSIPIENKTLIPFPTTP